MPTACTEACPAEATVGGTREELLAEAQRRIAENPGAYHPEIYGEHEVGGTNVLVLSPVPFEELGMKVGLGNEPLPNLTWAALSKIPKVVGIGCVGPLGHLLDHPPARGSRGRRARREGVTTHATRANASAPASGPGSSR